MTLMNLDSSIFYISIFILFVIFIIYSLPAFFLLKKRGESFRAVGKRYAGDIYIGDERKKIKKFLQGLMAFSLVLWVCVLFITFKTDYTFMIFLFPLLMYYFGIRFFLWEKSDLIENAKKQKE